MKVVKVESYGKRIDAIQSKYCLLVIWFKKTYSNWKYIYWS